MNANDNGETVAPTIQNCQFKESSNYGLYVYASNANATAAPAIQNTQVFSNSTYGLYANAASSGSTASPSLSNSVLAYNGTAVYALAGNGMTTTVGVQSTEIRHSTNWPVYLSGNGWANDLGGVNIHDNHYGAVAVAGALYVHRTWTPFSGLPYWLDADVTVGNGVILTLPADLLVKADSSSDLLVDGTLVLQSSAGHEIVFTSYRDDSYGGDTNGDGVTSGARGDWSGIALRSNLTTNFHDAIVRFASTALT